MAKKSDKGTPSSADSRRWLWIGIPALMAIIAFFSPYFTPMRESSNESTLLNDTKETNSVGYLLMGQVARIPYHSTDLSEIWKRNEPVILTETFVNKWPARTKWTPEYFVEQHAPLLQITKSSHPVFVYTSKGLPLQTETEVHKKQKKINVSIQTLIKAMNNSEESSYVYFSNVIESFPEIVQDVEPGSDWLIATPDDIQKHIWIGDKGVTAQTHYDASYNFFTQLYGHKQFLISPLEEFEKLYLFPSIHSSYRQSQVDFDNPNVKLFPNFRNIPTWNATLGPGDVLYLPPYWFHRVTSLSLSISYSTWSSSEWSLVNRKIEKSAVPFESDWTPEEFQVAIPLFLKEIIERVEGPGTSQRILSALAHQRYAPLFPRPSQPPFPCTPEGSFASSLPSRFEKATEEIVSLFLQLPSPYRQLYLHNYLEVIASHFLGVDTSIAFLLACYS